MTITKFNLNKVYKEDCISGMKKLPDNSIDLIIADPPYNLSKGGDWSWDNKVKLDGFGGNWNKVMVQWDDMSFEEYLSFTMAWLKEAKRVLKSTGSMWIHGTYHNIGVINVCLQLLDIEMINEVIWYKRNSFPNLSGRRLTASHESIIWCHSGTAKKREYFFNYKASKENSYPEDLLKTPDKQMRTVWDIPNNKTKDELSLGKHPTQKPLRLIKRMLDISADKNFVCLSPFAGSGTDCVAFQQMGLPFIGFDVDQSYVDLANSRLKSTPKTKSVSKKRINCMVIGPLCGY